MRAPGERRLFDLATVSGLVAAGLCLGAALFAALAVATAVRHVQRTGVTAPEAAETTVAPPVAPPPDLLARGLAFPVQGHEGRRLVDTFLAPRARQRVHHAIDIMAPRGTPVVAVDEGTVARLTRTGPGGTAVYLLDDAGRYGYYYAHLDGYAPGLVEGARVRRGDRLGVVGTTGNAPPGAPHLHLAIYEITDPSRPWAGRPVNPFAVWPEAGSRAAR